MNKLEKTHYQNLNSKANKTANIWIAVLLLFIQLVFFCSVIAADDVDSKTVYGDREEGIRIKEVAVEEACIDEKSHCLDAVKERIVDGIPVEEDCWKYEYIKSCNNGPTKNNCANIQQNDFNFVSDTCLSEIKVGEKKHCINVEKVFSRTSKQTQEIKRNKIIIDPDNKEAIKNLLCSSLCLDGNCSSVFKEEQVANDEIASSIAQLEMLSNIKKGLVDKNSLKFDVFGSTARKCHDKTAVFSNCCNNTGFLKDRGLTSCSSEQIELGNQRRSNKCVDLGEYCASESNELTKLTGKCLRKSRTFCCFPTILSKLIRVGARDQLGKSFGSAKHPQCGGLSLEDIEKLNFSKIDFQEFFDAEVQPMMRNYSSEDNEDIIKRSFPSGSQDGSSNSFPKINENGVNKKLIQDVDGEER